jgi:D-alanyl-D-alanine carboxypeptidase
MDAKRKHVSRSTWILRIILLVGTVISLFFVPWIMVKAWILPLPDSVQAQLDETLNYGFEGVLVYVDDGSGSSTTYAAGWHNREEQIPAYPNAYFKLASINKLYVAVALAKLVAHGSLDLDKSLASYLPGLEGRIEYADQITLRMMVQHRSGIPNFTDTENYWAAPKGDEGNLQLILDKPANFLPDSDYEYCNTNYLLIAKIMDKVLGYPHFHYIQKEILDRLSLNHTYSGLSAVNMDSLMSGYHQGHPFDLKTDEMGMVATAEDVGIFLMALNDGSLFDPGEQEIYSSIYEYKHAGWVPGYQSFAEYYKDINTVVVAFYSTTDPKLYLWNLSEIVNGRIVKIVRSKS